MTKITSVVLLFTILFTPKSALAGDGKIFFTTIVYGTVAGALVGVATLAFASNPGDNIMNIARGASLGLYVGIALGAYLYYQDNNDTPTGTINPDGLPATDSESPQSLLYKTAHKPLYGFSVYPTVQRGAPGVGVNLLSLNF
jgi:hypothetical protein